MAGTRRNGVLRHIHRLVGSPNGHGWSDAQLLQCFLANRDEQAFTVLVERHGRMVLNVCRHVLRQAQDAEDAFQATFLVLAQSAAKIRHDASLASWLYGVAYRTALKARTQMSKRRLHEKRASKVAHTGPELELAWQELQAVLAEEVNGLSEEHRAPFVLCCLEGLSKSDAARQLGWKEGTLSGRLAEARKLLQQRLARRGLTLATALCAGAWDANALAGAPDALIHSTVQAALGAAPAPVAALAAGLTPNILLSRGKLAGFLILVTGFVAGGAGIHLHRASATPPAAEPSASPARQAKKIAATKAPPQTKTDSIILRGRVFDPDDKPLAGVRAFGLTMRGGVKTLADNSFKAVDLNPARPRRVAFFHKERKLVGHVLLSADTKEPVTVRLRPGAVLTGRVLGADGKPLAGVRVTASYPLNPGRWLPKGWGTLPRRSRPMPRAVSAWKASFPVCGSIWKSAKAMPTSTSTRSTES